MCIYSKKNGFSYRKLLFCDGSSFVFLVFKEVGSLLTSVEFSSQVVSLFKQVNLEMWTQNRELIRNGKLADWRVCVPVEKPSSARQDCSRRQLGELS